MALPARPSSCAAGCSWGPWVRAPRCSEEACSSGSRPCSVAAGGGLGEGFGARREGAAAAAAGRVVGGRRSC